MALICSTTRMYGPCPEKAFGVWTARLGPTALSGRLCNGASCPRTLWTPRNSRYQGRCQSLRRPFPGTLTSQQLVSGREKVHFLRITVLPFVEISILRFQHQSHRGFSMQAVPHPTQDGAKEATAPLISLLSTSSKLLVNKVDILRDTGWTPTLTTNRSGGG